MNTADKLKKIAENEPKVYEAGYNMGLAKGKTDANKSFWYNYQHDGTRKSYSYAFFGTGWNDSTYNPQYKIYTEPEADRARYMFAWSGITDTRVPIEINSGITSKGSLFVEDCIFLGCKHLTTIQELYINDYKAPYTRWFDKCESLTNITIKGQIKNNGFDIHWSTKLTHKSLMSIIDALADKSGTGTTFTITLGTENLAKLTDAEKAIATQKGWSFG